MQKKKIAIICAMIALLICLLALLLLLGGKGTGNAVLQQTGTTLPSDPGSDTIPSDATEGTAPETTEPSASATEPGATEPFGEETVPGTDPSNPETQPSIPGTESAGTQPTTPSTQTTNPGTQTTTPTTKPTNPSTQPTTGGQSTTPTTQPATPTQPSPTLTIHTKDKTVLMVGETLKIDYTYTGTNTITFLGGSSRILSVDQNGVVTALSAGRTLVRLSDGQINRFIFIDVDSMIIHTPSDLIIGVGEKLQIDYTFLDDPSKLSWSSDDPSVFTIDNKGVVTGVGTGCTYARATDGYVDYTIYINVVAPEDKTTHFHMQMTGPLRDGVTKVAGQYVQINTANTNCLNANNQRSDRMEGWQVTREKTDPSKPDPEKPARNYYITTSNPKVVSIDTKYDCGYYDDFLYFNSAGTAIITFTSWDGYSESYKVTVKAEYDCAPGKTKLTPGEFAYYAMRVSVEDGMKPCVQPTSYLYAWYAEEDLTWEKAKALGHGTADKEFRLRSNIAAIIYAGFDEENGKHLFYYGTGEPGDVMEPYTPPTSTTGKIRFPSASITIKEQNLKLVEVLGNTSDEFVVYTSSNPKVAEMSGGLLLARSEGTAVITATYKGQTATMTVTVTRDPNIQRLIFWEKEVRVSDWGSGTKLSYYYWYSGTLTWSSSDISIATVTQDGVVNGRKPGQCIITVTDGVNSDTCIVTVTG